MTTPKFYPLSVPRIDGNEWEYVKDCLDTEWVSTAGQYVAEFESDFAAYVGAKHAVACSNGTAALQVALQCAGVKQGDEVILPTLTFIATPNAASYLGAHPVFVDCDDYYNICPDSVAAFLKQVASKREGLVFNSKTGRRIAAICPVHVFGNAANLERLQDIADEYGLEIVEDSAESLGTRYSKGRLSGTHTGLVGKVGAFSFNGNKIITTGGGGMIVTNDEDLATRAKYLTTTAKDDEVRFIHDEIGYNYRLTNLQAALGKAQLEQLPSFLHVKQTNFEIYSGAIGDVKGLTMPGSPDYASNNHWMYPIQIDESLYGKSRDVLMAHLNSHGVQTRPVWQLSHLQRPYSEAFKTPTPKSEKLLEQTLCLPCSTNLSAGDIEYIVERL